MSSGGQAYRRCYTFHGEGDISAAAAIQARLREHGLCSFFSWDPRPPRWRFFYETNMSRAELKQVLGPLMDRYKVIVGD